MCSINGKDGVNWVARRETFESEFPELLCTARTEQGIGTTEWEEREGKRSAANSKAQEHESELNYFVFIISVSFAREWF